MSCQHSTGIPHCFLLPRCTALHFVTLADTYVYFKLFISVTADVQCCLYSSQVYETLCGFCVSYKLKVCGNPAVGVYWCHVLTAYAHFVSVSHFGQTLSLLCVLSGNHLGKEESMQPTSLLFHFKKRPHPPPSSVSSTDAEADPPPAQQLRLTQVTVSISKQ